MNYRLLIILLILKRSSIIMINVAEMRSTMEICNLKLQCDFSRKFYLTCINFNKFDDLKFNCNTSYNIDKISYEFYSKTKLILDQSLNFTGLTLGNTASTYDYFFLIFFNLKGLDINFKQSVQYLKQKLNKKVDLFLSFSTFQFYLDGHKIAQSNSHSREAVVANYTQNIAFFEDYYDLLRIDYSKYQANTNPLIFNEAIIDTISINGIADSFIHKNILSFDSRLVSNSNKKSFKCEISELFLRGYRLKLDAWSSQNNLLNGLIFASIHQLTLTGVLDSIPFAELFEQFDQLRVLRLDVHNFIQFLQKSTKWMLHLNPMHNSSNNHEQMIIRFKYENKFDKKAYDYPLEDFCLFRNFPHHRQVLPIIDMQSNTSYSSCTLVWLLKNWIDLSDKHTINISAILGEYNSNTYLNHLKSNKSARSYFSPLLLRDLIKKCNFDRLVSLCDVNSNLLNSRQHQNDHFSKMNIYDAIYTSQTINFINKISILPLFCVSSLIINGLIVSTILCKQNKNELIGGEFAMYKYILMNSIFAILLSLLFVSQYFVECYEGYVCLLSRKQIKYNGVDYHLKYYFKLILFQFVSDSIETCSDLSILFFSINRYLFNKTSNKKLKSNKDQLTFIERFFRFSNRVKQVALLFIFIGLMLSSTKLAYTALNNSYDHKEYNNDYDAFLRNSLTFDLINVFYYLIYFSRFLLNDILLSLICLLFDILLIKSLRKSLAKKLEIESESNKKFFKLRQLKFKKVEINCKISIILNQLLMILLRLPELTFSLILTLDYFFNFNTFYCSVNSQLCSMLVDVSQTFHILLFSLQFFIYYRYNKVFRNAFKRKFGLSKSEPKAIILD
jgi:hypothetical protein